MRVFDRNLACILLLGFSSGLPLALTASTLTFWLTEAGLTMAGIGLFAAVATPYTLKFLWSPLIDGLRLPILTTLLGKRKGWLLLTQFALLASLLLLGHSDPALHIGLTALAALLVAFCSASQDIVIDALRVEMLPESRQGDGAAWLMFGYRLGMIVSSAGALYLAESMGWEMTYTIMAGLVLLGVVAGMLVQEPAHPIVINKEKEAFFQLYVFRPLADFITRPHWLAIASFVLLYKLGDAFMGTMTSPFYVKLGFTKSDVASIVKLFGLAATLIGYFLGGWLVRKLGIMRTLWFGGIVQALTNLGFAALAMIGPEKQALAMVITAENLAAGISSAAFVAYLSSLCNRQFTATQYALLSSLAAFGRTWLSTPAGFAVEGFGWVGFFIFSTVIAVPGMLLLLWLQRTLNPSALPAADSLK